MNVAPTPEQIRAQVRSLRKSHSKADVIGIHSQGRWSGPARVDDLQVYQCDSVLDVHHAMDDAIEAGQTKVILTGLSDSELGDDVLLRLPKRRFHPIKPVDILKGMFAVRSVDPRITTTPGLVEALIECEPKARFSPPSTGTLSLDFAWAHVLSCTIGVEEQNLDLSVLVNWACFPGNLERFHSLSDERQQAILVRLSQVGSGAPEFCRLLEQGHPPAVVALACGVIYSDSPSVGLQKAEGKAEDRFFRGWQPNRDGLVKLALTAEGCLKVSDAAAMATILEEADSLVAELGAGEFAYRSSVLRSGYVQRATMVGRQLAEVCRGVSAAGVRSLVVAKAALRAHAMAAQDDAELSRLDMAVRLLAWLEQQRLRPSGGPVSLREASQSYMNEGSFVDWARYSLIPGSKNRVLDGAYRELCRVVDTHRELDAKHFARLLTGSTASSVTKEPLPVEEAIAAVVAPIAGETRVLVIVADGMSWAVWRELSSSIPPSWHRKTHPQARIGALATIPSVTEVSRCSLFCGALTRGNADVEARGFAAHPALVAVSQRHRPPIVFHKAGLRADGPGGLANEVRNAIADENRRVVAVVINAVDDNLLKGDQLVPDWTLDRIHHLGALLEEGRDAGRCVILLSDHGHVLEVGTEGRQGDGGERWRATGKLAEGELLVEGPRVLAEDGNRVIVPWHDKLRYGPKRNGYHGGVTPQEMLIPIAIMSPDPLSVFGLEDTSDQLPDWWEVGLPTTSADQPTVQASKPPKILFAEHGTVSTSGASPSWLPALLKSPVLKSQRETAGRRALRDEELTELLRVMIEHGGTLTEAGLARELRLARFRVSGFITVAQRVLNVEGFEVLSRDDESETVKLDVKLLKTQFELP